MSGRTGSGGGGPLGGTRSQPFRVGIVGAGLVSRLHLACLRDLDLVELVGVADADAERARTVAAGAGVPAFDSQAALLRETRPDVVHVLTPPSTHADLCLEALDAGAHVYLEKPMSVTEADADRLVEASARSDRTLCVGYCMVFDPLVARLRRLLEAGELGEVVQVSAHYNYDPARIPELEPGHWYYGLPGSHLEDLAAHPASLVLHLAGEPRSIAPVEREDEIVALFDGERAIGLLTVSLRSRPEDITLEVRGTEASARLNFTNMLMTVERERSLPTKLARGVKNLELAAQLAVQTVSSSVRFALGRMDTTRGLDTMVREFYRRLAAGEPPPLGAEEGARVVRAVRTIWPDGVRASAARASPGT